MRKKALKIVIPILIVIIAIVTVILLIPRQIEFKGTYAGYNLYNSLPKSLNDSDKASNVLEKMDVDCDFTFKYNPISHDGKGTVTYDGKQLLVSSNGRDNKGNNLIYLYGNSAFPYSDLKITRDNECLLIIENHNEGLWIMFPKDDDPTIGEIRDRVIELGYGDWFVLD